MVFCLLDLSVSGLWLSPAMTVDSSISLSSIFSSRAFAFILLSVLVFVVL